MGVPIITSHPWGVKSQTIQVLAIDGINLWPVAGIVGIVVVEVTRSIYHPIPGRVDVKHPESVAIDTSNLINSEKSAV